MNVLGLDTATAASAACVLRSDGVAFEAEPAAARLSEPPAHAAELMPAAARCLDDAGLGWADLDAIAVGVGPGAFTGLRIGVATARALATATGAELRPVSSLAALADSAAEGESGGDGGDRRRPVLAAIDARRGELFAALYEDGEARWEPFAGAPDGVARRAADQAPAALAVGDGALRYEDVLVAAGVEVAPPVSRLHVVRGLAICRLASTAPAAAVESVLPDYLRLPDAKPRTA